MIAKSKIIGAERYLIKIPGRLKTDRLLDVDDTRKEIHGKIRHTLKRRLLITSKYAKSAIPLQPPPSWSGIRADGEKLGLEQWMCAGKDGLLSECIFFVNNDYRSYIKAVVAKTPKVLYPGMLPIMCRH
jgi:hypothetical protein